MSDSKTVTFIRFFYPGSFVSETSVRQVESREAPTEIPKGAFGWNFYDKTLIVENGEELWGKEKNTSGKTYIGEVYDIARVKAEMPNERILISNMENNGYKSVVVTGRGTFPLNDGDRVISDRAS